MPDAVDLQLDDVRLWSMRRRPIVCHDTTGRDAYNVCLLQHGEVVHTADGRKWHTARVTSSCTTRRGRTTCAPAR